MKKILVLSAALILASSSLAIAAQSTTYYTVAKLSKVSTGNAVLTTHRIAVFKAMDLKMPGTLTIDHMYCAGNRIVTFTFKGFQPDSFRTDSCLAIFKGDGYDDDRKMRNVTGYVLMQSVTTKKPRAEYREQISRATN